MALAWVYPMAHHRLALVLYFFGLIVAFNAVVSLNT